MTDYVRIKLPMLRCWLVISLLMLTAMKSFCQQQGGYDVVLEKGSIDDVVIDGHNRIIALDYGSHLIQIYSSGGILIKDIQLLEEKSSKTYNPKFSSGMLAVDTGGNIYCLTLSLEYFVSITKFDSLGKLVKKFPANSNMPPRSERVVAFLISKRNKMYLRTFPHGRTQAEENPVYVYDLECNFLGKVDYNMEDLKGNIYKFGSTQKDLVILTKYGRATSKHPKQVTSLAERRFSQSSGWAKGYGNTITFVGFDGQDNLYVTNGKVINNLGNNLSGIVEIHAPLEMLDSQGILSSQTHMRVGFDGDLYLFGNKLGKDTHKVVSSVLVRIKK